LSFLAYNSRLRSAVCRPYPPQRPVLGLIHWFRQCETIESSDHAVRCSTMWCGGILVVSFSPLEGELTGSSWHLRYAPCAQEGSGDVIGLLQWVWIVPLASGPRRFERAIWYLTIKQRVHIKRCNKLTPGLCITTARDIWLVSHATTGWQQLLTKAQRSIVLTATEISTFSEHAFTYKSSKHIEKGLKITFNQVINSNTSSAPMLHYRYLWSPKNT